MDQSWQSIAETAITTLGGVVSAVFAYRAHWDAREARKDRIIVQAIRLSIPPAPRVFDDAPPTPRDPTARRPK